MFQGNGSESVGDEEEDARADPMDVDESDDDEPESPRSPRWWAAGG